MEGKERIYPIELGHPGRWRDSFDIKLPDGYAVDETPDPVQVEIPAARAADFRKLEGAILFDEKGTAVLKKQ